jgi:hypothetical protein
MQPPPAATNNRGPEPRRAVHRQAPDVAVTSETNTDNLAPEIACDCPPPVNSDSFNLRP